MGANLVFSLMILTSILYYPVQQLIHYNVLMHSISQHCSLQSHGYAVIFNF